MPYAEEFGKIGKLHPCWKAVRITPLYNAIRNLFQSREWRFNIFKRDNFTCTICQKQKEVSGKLEADHYPKGFAVIIAEQKITSLDQALNCKELWNINNGRTLCKDCHKTTANYMGKARKKVI